MRHVERTRILVHLIDPEPTLRGEHGRAPERDYAALREELSAYSSDLSQRTERVYLTKSDLVPDTEARRAMTEALCKNGLEPRWISAATGEGIRELLHELAREIQAA